MLNHLLPLQTTKKELFGEKGWKNSFKGQVVFAMVTNLVEITKLLPLHVIHVDYVKLTFMSSS